MPPTTAQPVIFIRHGETQWNEKGRYQGSSDTQLSNIGIESARLNGQILRKIISQKDIDYTALELVSSPLKRAQQTAHYIATQIGYTAPIKTEPRFAELSLGRWEGLTSLEVKEKYYHERKSRKNDRWHFKPQGGESMAERMPCLTSALNQLKPHTIIITHSMVLRIILHILTQENRQIAAQAPIPHRGAMIWDGEKIHIDDNLFQ